MVIWYKLVLIDSLIYLEIIYVIYSNIEKLILNYEEERC